MTESLTLGGWIVMLLSVGFVTGLLGWCLWRVFTSPPRAEVTAETQRRRRGAEKISE